MHQSLGEFSRFPSSVMGHVKDESSCPFGGNSKDFSKKCGLNLTRVYCFGYTVKEDRCDVATTRFRRVVVLGRLILLRVFYSVPETACRRQGFRLTGGLNCRPLKNFAGPPFDLTIIQTLETAYAEHFQNPAYAFRCIL